MNGNITAGAILHYCNFEFEYGPSKNKFLVVLGAKPEYDYLHALATTRKKIKKAEQGCHQTPSTYFFISQESKNVFSQDTWIVLSEPYVISRDEVKEKMEDKTIIRKGNLNRDLTEKIRVCLEKSFDLSDMHRELL